MRRRIPSITILLTPVALASSATVAAAQRASDAPGDTTPENLPILPLRAPATYGAWVAMARHSAYRTRTGVPGHRDFYLSNIRVGWALGGGDDPTRMVNGAYFIDVVPAAVSTSMPEYQWNSRCQPGTLCPGATPILHDAYAFGLTPLGWELMLGRGPARLTMEASGGGLWFSRRIPDPEATRFNFTASAGPTLELRLASGQTLRFGYLWHHTSNGGTGRVNPGMNSGIASVGMLWRH
jgi:lipid A 3-O-deacylase PagL